MQKSLSILVLGGKYSQIASNLELDGQLVDIDVGVGQKEFNNLSVALVAHSHIMTSALRGRGVEKCQNLWTNSTDRLREMQIRGKLRTSYVNGPCLMRCNVKR